MTAWASEADLRARSRKHPACRRACRSLDLPILPAFGCQPPIVHPFVPFVPQTHPRPDPSPAQPGPVRLPTPSSDPRHQPTHPTHRPQTPVHARHPNLPNRTRRTRQTAEEKKEKREKGRARKEKKFGSANDFAQRACHLRPLLKASFPCPPVFFVHKKIRCIFRAPSRSIRKRTKNDLKRGVKNACFSSKMRVFRAQGLIFNPF